jgi:hypothetical protein
MMLTKNQNMIKRKYTSPTLLILPMHAILPLAASLTSDGNQLRINGGNIMTEDAQNAASRRMSSWCWDDDE